MSISFQKNIISEKKESDGYLVVSSNKGNYAHFKGVAAFIWKNLQKKITKEKLVESICEEYKIEKDVALEDLNEFIKKAKKAGFIKEVKK